MKTAVRSGGRLCPLTEVPHLATEVPSLVLQAGHPYFEWFYGTPRAARTAVARLLDDPTSEIAASRTTVLLAGARLAGLFVAMGGDELARCRKREMLTLLASTPREERDGLVARLADVRALFPPVAPEEYYLSKIAVVEDLRRTGLGRDLLDAYVRAGREAGFARFRLDVSADNHGAICLYRAAGFELAAERAVGSLRYRAMTLGPSRG